VTKVMKRTGGPSEWTSTILPLTNTRPRTKVSFLRMTHAPIPRISPNLLRTSRPFFLVPLQCVITNTLAFSSGFSLIVPRPRLIPAIRAGSFPLMWNSGSFVICRSGLLLPLIECRTASSIAFRWTCTVFDMGFRFFSSFLLKEHLVALTRLALTQGLVFNLD